VAQFTLEFDAKGYSLLAVQKACHRYSDQASFEITQASESAPIQIIVFLRLTDSEETLAQNLRIEVLDQQMREVVRTETAGVRNLILAHAFSRTGLIHQDGHPLGKLA